MSSSLPHGLLTLVLALVTWPAPAQAIPIRVRGGAALYAQARFDDKGVLELRGQVTDDARSPIAAAWVLLETSSDLSLGDAVACGDQGARVARRNAALGLQSTTEGELCLRWPDAPSRGDIMLTFAGDDYHGGARLEVPFDRAAAQRLATTLRFEPRPAFVDLDADVVAIGATVRLQRATAHASRQGLSVALMDEDGKVLAQSTSSGDGKVRFVLDADVFADPGAGRLEARFDGNAQLAPARDLQPITRRATTELSLGAPLSSVAPRQEVAIAVRVHAARGVVDGGVVEARSGGRPVATVPVQGGRAILRLIPAIAEGASEAAVTLRYLPASPWWQPGPELNLRLPVSPPPLAWRFGLGALVAIAAAWVTLGWRRSRERPPEPKQPLAPGIHVISPRPRRGGPPVWEGRVLDAHDGSPLVGAEIVVRQPTLEADSSVARCVADDDGRFRLALDTVPQLAELSVAYPTHSSERQPLPPPGQLQVALMTRRRTLLKRLVQWGRSRGGAFDTAPEPTPGQIRRASSGNPAVDRWAAAVEEVAFGPGVVDRDTEDRIRSLEPR